MNKKLIEPYDRHMKKTTQPIFDKKDRERFLACAAEKDKEMFILALLMIYEGFRVGDTRYLTVGDVKGDFIEIEERKTLYKKKQYEEDIKKGKKSPRKPKEPRKVKINSIVKRYLKKYIQGKSNSDYLVPSPRNKKEPLSYSQIRRRLKKIADEVGLKDFCTHSLRKTAAKMVMQKDGKEAAQNFLGHKSFEQTVKYLGSGQAMRDESIDGMEDLTGLINDDIW